MTKPRALFVGVFFASWGVFMALGAGFIRSAAPTYDEPVHLASGYGVLAGAAQSLNYKDHPPFGETWAALPLVFLKPLTFFTSPEWTARRVYHYADLFLYKNRVPAETMMNRARLWCLASWGAILCLALLEWSLRLGGPWALGFAGVLFAFCPPLISNAALVTTDAPATVFYFLIFWALSFSPRRAWHWILAGAFMGLGMASKFSLVAAPALALAGLLAEARIWKGKKYLPLLSGAALMAVVALLCLWAAYRGDLSQYWDGLSATFSRLNQGRGSFLLGTYSVSGWRLYFPAALAVKTPIPTLVLAALGLVFWLRAPSADRFWAAMPPAAYFCAAELSKTQIGYRYILPVYPFLLLAAAWGAAWLWRAGAAARAVTLGLCLWLVAGVSLAYPYYLAYFNEIAGGPSGGYRWLVDSNLDWGQDLKTLAAYLRDRGSPPILLTYFGSADPAVYGIRYVPFGFISGVERAGDIAKPSDLKPLLWAISATSLQGVYYQDHAAFTWLRGVKPVFAAGHSIFVYDLSGDQKSRASLRGVMASNSAGALAAALGLNDAP